jgi:uncharacterized protein (DUF1501 family)
MHYKRREFLRTIGAGTAVLTFGGQVPLALGASAVQTRSSRILVVVELQGGNDGLNTLIPATDDLYKRLRPTLAVRPQDVLDVAQGLGFHGALRGFADLLESGRLSVIQGVGYPNPNRSHFEAMDIWHTCQRKEETRTDGWLGRWLEETGGAGETDPRALHIGSDKLPFALMSRTVRVPSVRSLEQFRLQGSEDPGFRDAIETLTDTDRPAEDDLLSFVQSSTSSALAASERLTTASSAKASSVVWPASPLAGQLQTISRLIRSDLNTSVYYVTHGGFDTHAQQPDAHRGLLRQLADSIKAFLDELQESGHQEQVVVMCFSEFGRRVEQNASDGTDHGTAGPVFLAGAGLQPGLIGTAPRLDDLQDGDLKHTADFREVYSAISEHWFSVPSERILKGVWKPVNVFQTNSG